MLCPLALKVPQYWVLQFCRHAPFGKSSVRQRTGFRHHEPNITPVPMPTPPPEHAYADRGRALCVPTPWMQVYVAAVGELVPRGRAPGAHHPS
jgi:hypothetical protein